MTVDEKIYSLMAIAEDQQKLTLEFINEQKNEILQLKKEREAIFKLHQSNMLTIEKISRKRISLTWMFVTSIGCATCALLIALSASFYLKDTLRGIVTAEASYELLKSYNADIKTCTHNGVDYPCVRVMSKWGVYKDKKSNVADLYILDPK